MKAGDLVWFRQISVGKEDDPPYSQDGEWRVGILIEKNKVPWQQCLVLYRGKIWEINPSNICTTGSSE